MSMSPQDIFNKYKRQSLGMPKASPSSSTKISGLVSIHYIFIGNYKCTCTCGYFLLLHLLCVVFEASLFLFLVQYSLVCCSSWLDHIMFVWERDTRSVFIAQSTLVSFLLLCECSLFASTAFSIRFVQNFFVLICSQVCSTLWSLMISTLVSCSK